MIQVESQLWIPLIHIWTISMHQLRSLALSAYFVILEGTEMSATSLTGSQDGTSSIGTDPWDPLGCPKIGYIPRRPLFRLRSSRFLSKQNTLALNTYFNLGGFIQSHMFRWLVLQALGIVYLSIPTSTGLCVCLSVSKNHLGLLQMY